jgi:hypothetical protein
MAQVERIPKAEEEVGPFQRGEEESGSQWTLATQVDDCFLQEG